MKKSRLVVRLTLAFALTTYFVSPTLAQNPALSQSPGVNSDLVRIQRAALAYANPANSDRVIVQDQTNQRLATIIAANNNRLAENNLAFLVIEAISHNPARSNEYVSTVAAAAPLLAPGVTRLVRQAYPFRMITVTATTATSATTATPAAPGASAARSNVKLDELADADAESSTGPSDQNDPFEGLNRVIFTVNDTLDSYIFRPLAWTYGRIMPGFAKRAVNHAFRNLKSPVIFGNDLLQGEIGDAGVTLLRFVINSTAGIAGLFEVAEEFDLQHHDADFGQTLHAYNIGAGPYIMIPLFGPASARDGVGRLVDAFMDPITYVLDPTDRTLFALGKSLVRREELLEQLDELRKTSVDYYAAIRSLYYQDRAKTLRRGKPPAGADFDEFLKVEE